jgi:hypothetical protein
VLFDACFGRYTKACKMLNAPKYTMDTAKRLGLEVDKRLPWFVKVKHSEMLSFFFFPSKQHL